jgi:predicted transposase YbfD/YdcC
MTVPWPWQSPTPVVPSWNATSAHPTSLLPSALKNCARTALKNSAKRPCGPHPATWPGAARTNVIMVKRNQPGPHAQLAVLPWRDVSEAYDKRERRHGRTERRTLKVTAVARGLAFPHAAQAIQIVRRRKVRGKWSRETCYAVTSLTAAAASADQLAAIIRRHWGIEDRLHRVRDIDFGEDHSQIRTEAGSQIMAGLRNLAITILQLAGHASIAAALRYHARRPARPLQTIMKGQPCAGPALPALPCG